MAKVERVPLQSIAEIERVGVAPMGMAGDCYVSLEDIDSASGEIRITAREPPRSTKFRFGPEHVLYGKLRPYLQKVARASVAGCCSTDILPIRPSNRLHRDYLFHYLRTPQFTAQATQAAVGVNLPRLSPSVLSTFAIPLPTLEEQRRIAEILDKADALRAKRRAALAQLDTLTQSIFLDMFGDPATNPKGWPVRVIGDLLESAVYGTSEKSESTGEFPVLRMNNITRTGEIDLSELKYMNLEESERERYLVRAGDVLFNRTNSAELVGKTAIFRESRPMAYAGYLIRLRVTRENHPEYLACFLNTDYSKRVLRGMCKSIIGMANINATEVQGVRIPQPPLQVQREFARRVTGVEKLRSAHRDSLAAVDTLFASLQHRAFRGEL